MCKCLRCHLLERAVKNHAGEVPITQPVSAQKAARNLESLQEKYKVAVLRHLLMEVSTNCASTQASFKGFGDLSADHPP